MSWFGGPGPTSSGASPTGPQNTWRRRAFDALPLARPSRAGPVDSPLAALVIALIGFSVVMVYSASAVEATVRFKDPQHFLKRQAIYALLGVTTMWLVSRIDYRRLRRLTYPVLGATLILLALCVLGFGHRAGNADRWLALGPFHVQPSEIAKLALVLWLSYSLAKKAEQVKSFTIGFLPHLLIAGSLMLLCLKQPDFGSAVVLLFLTFTMLFVAGAKISYLLGFAMLGAAVSAALVRFRDYRYERVLAWLDMSSHRLDFAYQPFQAVMSFGSGGLFGLGLGRGLQVLYLPEAHTDFIAAIVGEELGFLGVLGLCAAYLAVVSRGVRIAFRAPDEYGCFIAFGISAMIGVQALVNLAVAMAILPTKGLTLPFVSFGGSSLLVNAAAAGILLNISRPRPEGGAPRAAEAGPPPSASAVVVVSAEEGAPGW